MAQAENSVWKRCLLRLSAVMGVRLFRNNTGSAYAGKGFTLRAGQTYRAKGGERIILDPRLVSFGLHKGSADGIGWWSRVITPEMVGQRLAQFVSLETKAGRGTASQEQLKWADNVRVAGGIVIITTDPETAAKPFERAEGTGA